MFIYRELVYEEYSQHKQELSVTTDSRQIHKPLRKKNYQMNCKIICLFVET